MLMREAAKQFSWKLNYGGIALMWRGGCIIRRFVQSFMAKESRDKDNNDGFLIHLLHQYMGVFIQRGRETG